MLWAGIDQTLLILKPHVDDEFLERYMKLSKGHSLVITDEKAEALYHELKENNLVSLHEFACGTKLVILYITTQYWHYDKSVLLGVMSKDIEHEAMFIVTFGNTSSRMDMNHLTASKWSNWPLFCADF